MGFIRKMYPKFLKAKGIFIKLILASKGKKVNIAQQIFKKAQKSEQCVKNK